MELTQQRHVPPILICHHFALYFLLSCVGAEARLARTHFKYGPGNEFYIARACRSDHKPAHPFCPD